MMCIICAQSVEDQNKWKLVTLWIGANDLCGHCSSSVSDLHLVVDEMEEEGKLIYVFIFLSCRMETSTMVRGMWEG